MRTTKCSVEPPQQTAMDEGRTSPSVIVSEQVTAQTPSKPRDVDSPSPGNTGDYSCFSHSFSLALGSPA